jgi:predicted O-methyltransferase YrrM
MAAMLKNANLSSGACPARTFPNSHLLKSPVLRYPVFSSKDSVSSEASTLSQVSQLSVESNATWSAPVPGESPLAALREAVKAENWELLFTEGKTLIRVNASWSASEERAGALRCLARLSRARRILEIGAFCGVTTLTLAEALPKESSIVAIELDPFLANYARHYIAKSAASHDTSVRLLSGKAIDHLQKMARARLSSADEPYDFVVIDADKASMMEYFQVLWTTPGMLSPKAVIVVDMTPFKGQPPKRYVRFGQEDKWEASSGQEQIDAFRRHAEELPGVDVSEFGKLLVVRKLGH